MTDQLTAGNIHNALAAVVNQIDIDEQLRLRAIQHAITEATAWHWRQRADTFQQVGNETCDAIAEACRNKAALIEMEAANV